MDPNTFPTKGNLILAKNSLKLSRQGYELMDKKRNILIREMMELIDQAKDIQTQIDVTFRTAYTALQKANMEIGIAFVQQIACTVPVENSIRIKTRSVMGTEIPLVEYDKTTNTPTYAYYSTKMSLDEAKAAFEKVKELSIRLSMVENAAIRLAANIKKTQKRANALKNITIPKYEALTKDIQNALEEKEREEFTRLKVIKLEKFPVATLQEELQQVQRYMTIQNIRFPGKFCYDINVPPEFLQMNLPVFLFQPLVENSVEHGFSNKENECYISISCQLENELLHFLVADNGSGMSQEQLKTFQCSGKTSPKGHHSIGLANVNQRLHSYYGEEYGLLVESIPGEGTIIDIVLPSSAINIEPSFFQPELSKTISLSQNPSQ
mgnify:CR=1 FL=1